MLRPWVQFRAQSGRVRVQRIDWDAPTKLARPLSEAAIVMLLTTAFITSYLVQVNGASITWDLVNHHLYLGRNFSQSRLAWDHFAAATMSCQVPWSYWPLALVVESGGGAHAVGALYGLFAGASVMAMWVLVRAAVPGRSAEAMVWRITCLMLAFTSALWIAQLDYTSNDMLVCALVIGSVAAQSWFLRGFSGSEFQCSCLKATAFCFLSGFLFAAAIAAKISVLMFAPAYTVAWVWGIVTTRHISSMKLNAACVCLGLALGLALLGGPFWLEAWRECGSPVYPIAVEFFQPLLQSLSHP
jgi:hypothetical protein